MIKPIKITLLGLIVATTTALAVPHAHADASDIQAFEATEQSEETLKISGRRWQSVRWRKKWVCYHRPVVFFRQGRKIVAYKRYCYWKKFRVQHS